MKRIDQGGRWMVVWWSKLIVTKEYVSIGAHNWVYLFINVLGENKRGKSRLLFFFHLKNNTLKYYLNYLEYNTIFDIMISYRLFDISFIVLYMQRRSSICSWQNICWITWKFKENMETAIYIELLSCPKNVIISFNVHFYLGKMDLMTYQIYS